MSPADMRIVTRKAKLIEEDLNKLQEFENLPIEDYISTLEVRLQVERLMERIIGRMVDINYHLLKEEFGKIPEDYHKSFMQLAENNLFEKSFAVEIAESTGLRNALAHEYDSVDDALVHASIKKCLQQVPKYLDSILNRIGAN